MTFNKYNFKHKVVLVTGSGTGIGAEIAKVFLDNGAFVALVGRRLEKLEETVKGYDSSNYLLLSKDISISSSSQEIVDAILKRFGHLDVVISNAGVFVGAPIEEMTIQQWNKVMDVNLNANFYLAKAIYPELKKTKGNFIVTSSVSGIRGDWKQYAYNASKHGVTGLVRCLALDWGKDGIRVNAVAPAFTETPMTAGIAKESDPNYQEEIKPLINRIALKRVGQPKDIAPSYLFLASEDASYITGVILPVDGGTSASTGQAHFED